MARMVSSPPLFSVVIPTYNRPQTLIECLDSVCALDAVAGGYEVIVVDDGSHVDLSGIVARYAESFPLSLLRQANGGPASARNNGAAHASGRFLAFTDDDCRPAADWLQHMAAHLNAAPDLLVGGCVRNALIGNIYSTASQLLLHYILDYYQANHHEGTFFTSNNMAVSRDCFLEVGGFDVAFAQATNEDRELCERWRYHRLPLRYAPSAIVLHAHELTLRAYGRQHFNYGRGAHRYHLVRQRYRHNHIHLEPWPFYRDLLRYPYRERTSKPPCLLSCLLGLAQAIYALGFLFEKTKLTAGET